MVPQTQPDDSQLQLVIPVNPSTITSHNEDKVQTRGNPLSETAIHDHSNITHLQQDLPSGDHQQQTESGKTFLKVLYGDDFDATDIDLMELADSDDESLRPDL